MDNLPLIIVTGGPGSGKTSLLNELQRCGYITVGDSPRTIIQERIKSGMTPRPGAYEFAQQALKMDVENYDRYASADSHVFFERGVLDALCMLDLVKPLSEGELETWLSKYRYFPKVFTLPPWKEIYVNDAERDHSFEHAELVYDVTQDWYRKCLYDVVVVPEASIPERCAFVLDTLEGGQV